MMMMEQKNKKYKRMIMFISTTLFVIALILNIIMKEALYNYNLKAVPQLQKHSFFGSDFFIILMNIFSNIFNPIICAGYVILFYVMSYRKLQILVFLIWFILISSILSFLKQFIQEPRPFWIQDSGIKMLQWSCYTQYGCPSGHATLGLVLIQFIIRFYARGNQWFKKKIIIFYIIGLIVQGLVVFSRVILGMHSINQISFGLLLGFYSFIPYYLYIEKCLLKSCIFLNKIYYRFYILFIVAMLILFFMSIQIITTYALNYNNKLYWQSIKGIQQCKDVKIFRSFEYRCFQDSALIMSAFGIMTAFVFIKKPQNLMKVPIYGRTSKKFILKVTINIIIALIPVGIFFNPLWRNLQFNTDDLSLLIWFLYCFGFFFGMFFLVYSPQITQKINLQDYTDEIVIQQQMRYSRRTRNKLRRKSKELIMKQKQYLQNSIQIPK